MDTKITNYLSRFYEPKITAYEFLKYFFAYLKKMDVDTVNVDRDLVGFLYKQKQICGNDMVLEEIRFGSNGVNYFSEDIEDSVFCLYIGGLLGKYNPSFGDTYIKCSGSEVDDIIRGVPNDVRDDIERIAHAYIDTYYT